LPVTDAAAANTNPGPAPAKTGPAPPVPTLAEPVSRVVPQYPPLAAKTNTRGRVSVTVEIDEQGKVVAAKAVSGPQLLRPAAEEAIKQWQFKPATLRGVPVRSEMTISVEFRQ
jgi:protein TonB